MVPLFHFKGITRKKQDPRPPEAHVPSDYGAKLKAHWNDAELLRLDVLGAMQGNYPSAAREAAMRLLGIDPDPERAFLLQAALLLTLGDLDQAELTLMQYVTHHGLTPTVLAHLGNIQLVRGHWPYAADLLWQALEFDPNHPEALAWWESVHATTKGPESVQAALERTAQLPGSWRARARLAARASRLGTIATALDWLRKALVEAPKDGMGWLLVAPELAASRTGMDLLLSVYDPAQHGIQGGLNLLHWLRSQERNEDARALLAKMMPFETAETRREMARQALELSRVPQEQLQPRPA